MKKIVLFFALCALPLCYAQEPVDAQTGASQQANQTEQTVRSDKPNYKRTVVLKCDLHCQGCCDKIMKNIAFEKGVKDLVCDLKTKTVTVTYDTRKTDLETLLKAFEKIGKPATVESSKL
jgi:copper chaperone CopZ